MSKYKDAYSVLGVGRHSTIEEVKQAYRKLCKQHHPDQHTLASLEHRQAAEQTFKEITEAYQRLTARNFPQARHAPRKKTYSNGVVAAIISAPLTMLGAKMAWESQQEDAQGRRQLPGWRPHGMLSPPVNPFLREDLQPRVRSRWQGTAEHKEGGQPQP